MSATGDLLAFVRARHSLPSEVCAAALHLLGDTLAVGAAGRTAPGADGVLAAARSWGAGEDARLLGSAERLPAFPYTPLEQAMQALGHAEAALGAAEQGCDAVVIDSIGDYGLAAMRAMLPIPAIGSGEAALAEVAQGGRRFGIVTVWPESMNFILTDRLHACGVTPLCTGVVNIGSDTDAASLSGPDSYLAQVREGQAAIMQRVLAGIEQLAAGGAEAVMLGCTCMSSMAERAAAASPLPVVNPLAAGLRAALAAPTLALTPQIREGRAALLRAMVDAVAGEMAEDCPVCMTG